MLAIGGAGSQTGSVMPFPKVIFIATALVGVPALAAALVLRAPSRVLEVRLGRLLRTQGEPPGAFGDQRAEYSAGKPSLTGETRMADR